MQRIHALRTLALCSALILALGGIGCAGEEDTGDTGESPTVEAAPLGEASGEATDEMSSPAEKTDTEASEAEEE